MSVQPKFSTHHAAAVAAVTAKWSTERAANSVPVEAKGMVATPNSAPKAAHSSRPRIRPSASGTRLSKQKVKSQESGAPRREPGWVKKDRSR